MDWVLWTILGMNMLGFLLAASDCWLMRHTVHFNVTKLVNVVAVLFGAGGILLFVVLFDRRLDKANMMSRVIAICSFVIQLVLLMMYPRIANSELNFSIVDFFSTHRILLYWLLVLNLVAFCLYGLDKKRAIEGKRRIRIVTLLGLAFFGGSVGAWLAMQLFRHKTRVNYFTIGIPLMMLMQLLVLLLVMNWK